jgi:SAM-dependent methyltransferase
VVEDLWEANSDWWVSGFTEGADPEYVEQILPLAAAELAGRARVLDVGCGEGQIARLAAAECGASLSIGVDPTRSQVVEAALRGGGVLYARSGAEELPFVDGAFDAVVACLVFEHIDDAAAAIGEVARVLAPGGRFCFFLNHPLLQTPGSGWIVDVDLDEQYWRIGPYLVEDHSIEEIAPGVKLPFVHRPLSVYVNALIDAGLVVGRMLEPAPPDGFLAVAQEYRDAATIPRLLYLRADKPVA